MAGQGQGAKVKGETDHLNLLVTDVDDEFEEFPKNPTPAHQNFYTQNENEDEDAKVWDNQWDNNSINDEFSLKLKEEVEKQKALVLAKGPESTGEGEK